MNKKLQIEKVENGYIIMLDVGQFILKTKVYATFGDVIKAVALYFNQEVLP
jgi:hypothetical protein